GGNGVRWEIPNAYPRCLLKLTQLLGAEGERNVDLAARQKRNSARSVRHCSPRDLRILRGAGDIDTVRQRTIGGRPDCLLSRGEAVESVGPESCVLSL